MGLNSNIFMLKMLSLEEIDRTDEYVGYNCLDSILYLRVYKDGHVVSYRNRGCYDRYHGYEGILNSHTSKPLARVSIAARDYVYTHALVAYSFVELDSVCREDFGNYVVNHMDLNQLNNNADNLELVSSEENTIHGAILNRLLSGGYLLAGCKVSAKGMVKGLCKRYDTDGLFRWVYNKGNIKSLDAYISNKGKEILGITYE